MTLVRKIIVWKYKQNKKNSYKNYLIWLKNLIKEKNNFIKL